MPRIPICQSVYSGFITYTIQMCGCSYDCASKKASISSPQRAYKVLCVMMQHIYESCICMYECERVCVCVLQVDKQREQIRQLERKLKQAVLEQEHLSEHSTLLTTEIDKCVPAPHSHWVVLVCIVYMRVCFESIYVHT